MVGFRSHTKSRPDKISYCNWSNPIGICISGLKPYYIFSSQKLQLR